MSDGGQGWIPGELVTLDPPLYEYVEERSIEAVNTRAEQGWRVHTALLVPGSNLKLYLMERPRRGDDA